MAKILFATTAAGVKFYPVTITDAVVHIDGNEQKKLSEVLGEIQDSIDAIDYSGKADKVANATNGNFAGLDANGNLTDSGSKAADFDAAGAAATAKSEVIGEFTDASSANTIYGAKKKAEEEAAAVLGAAGDAASANTVYGAKAYADSLVVGGVIYKGTVDGTTNVLPTEGYKTGWEYAVTVNGTYAGKVCQAGDFLIANKDYAAGATAANDWDIKQGTVAVADSAASLVIGTSTKIAEVEGVDIHVTQVEDMTKIEAVAVADTTEYADVTALFTAPAGGE